MGVVWAAKDTGELKAVDIPDKVRTFTADHVPPSLRKMKTDSANRCGARAAW